MRVSRHAEDRVPWARSNEAHWTLANFGGVSTQHSTYFL